MSSSLPKAGFENVSTKIHKFQVQAMCLRSRAPLTQTAYFGSSFYSLLSINFFKSSLLGNMV